MTLSEGPQVAVHIRFCADAVVLHAVADRVRFDTFFLDDGRPYAPAVASPRRSISKPGICIRGMLTQHISDRENGALPRLLARMTKA